jgi:hypothetical protein
VHNIFGRISARLVSVLVASPLPAQIDRVSFHAAAGLEILGTVDGSRVTLGPSLQLGTTWQTLQSAHDAMITAPRELSQVLMELA